MNRRSFFTWLGIGTCLTLVPFRSFSLSKKEQHYRYVADPENRYTLAYYPPCLYSREEGQWREEVNDGTKYMLIERVREKDNSCIFDKLMVGDYVDASEGDVKFLGILYHAGRYKRVDEELMRRMRDEQTSIL